MLEVKVKKHFSHKEQRSFSLDVSFAAADGITVLMGASGAGKTTVLKLIAGILTPDEGFIKLNGQTFFDSQNNVNLPIQKRRVGFVFQDYALFPHLTARRNIAYGIKEKNAKDEKALEMLALFHIEHIAERRPAEMSGGEQQRVALARALASDPQIVLLDEPLSAVDVETRTKLLDEIDEAQKRTKIPFIYVTHNEKEAERLEKKRITLRGGRLINEN
jgi:molybdate transport system ATP-binding protein